MAIVKTFEFIYMYPKLVNANVMGSCVEDMTCNKDVRRFGDNMGKEGECLEYNYRYGLKNEVMASNINKVLNGFQVFKLMRETESEINGND